MQYGPSGLYPLKTFRTSFPELKIRHAGMCTIAQQTYGGMDVAVCQHQKRKIENLKKQKTTAWAGLTTISLQLEGKGALRPPWKGTPLAIAQK